MARTPRRRESTLPATGSVASEPRRVRENLPRPSAAPVAAGISRPEVAKKRRNPLGFFGRLPGTGFIGEVVSELRKVTWPSFSETRYLTIVVVVVSVAVGLLLGGVDLLFGTIIERLFF